MPTKISYPVFLSSAPCASAMAITVLPGSLPVVGTRHLFHGHMPSISTSSEKLRTTRITTMIPSTVTLLTDWSTTIVRMMSAMISTSSPSRITRPEVSPQITVGVAISTRERVVPEADEGTESTDDQDCCAHTLDDIDDVREELPVRHLPPLLWVDRSSRSAQIRRRPGVTAAATTAVFATGEGPGVTAAATTAVFATGEGPGLTAAATTAVLATGAPMTPTLPTRAGLTGISGSYRRGYLSASIEAMIAWMGIRPLAISWPPERRAAAANGAAHRFSQMSTPAVVPGSIAAARCATSSAASNSAS